MEKQELPIQQMPLEKFAMRPQDLTGQVALIQEVMTEVMKDGEHYGKIPGTNKPTLYQPGAEKLILTFRLDPEFEILSKVEDKEFLSYTIRCTLFHIPSGNKIASGIGACNSREAKYRYRYDDIPTGKSVPSGYWNAKKIGDNREMKRYLGGDGFKPRKIDGTWVIVSTKKVEHDNPWDFQNTILKMAAKRAKVAATLNATAASDIFTQDVEDLPPEMINGHTDVSNSNGHDTQPEPQQRPKPRSQQGKSYAPVGNGKETYLRKQFYAKLQLVCHKNEDMMLKEFQRMHEGITSLDDLNNLTEPELKEIMNMVDILKEEFIEAQKQEQGR